MFKKIKDILKQTSKKVRKENKEPKEALKEVLTDTLNK
jgi:hypothetical protein